MSGSRSSSSSPSLSGIFGRGILSGRIKSKRALFLLRLIFFFLLFYSLWYVLCPVYNRVLAPVAVQMLKLSEIGGVPITVSSEVKGERILVSAVQAATNPDVTVKVKGKMVHFDMVLLFALIWAVPHIKWKKRVRIFLLGFAIIFVLHQFKIFIYVKREYCLNVSVGDALYGSPFQKQVYRYTHNFLLMVSNQVLPILIWSLLYVKYWWKKGPELGSP